MPLGEDFRDRLREVLGCPTAPFHEERVHAVLRGAVRASKRLRDRVDRYGNLEVVYGPGRPRLWFACHTDHPALEAEGGGRARVVGGIRPEALLGQRLRTFEGDGPRPVVSAVLKKSRPARVRLRGSRGLQPGTPLVLDVAAVRLTKRHVRARAVDDLCAVAACLAMFDRLAAQGWRGTVGALFTRGEEVGFAGALGWVRATRAPRATTTVVNLEMSSERPHTPQGGGPVLRVGDRMSIFGTEVALELEATAVELKQTTPGFSYQRALMDGGVCEATVYGRAGFRAGALCLPLRNYHNHAARGGMGLEYVDAADAGNLVRWMTAHARRAGARGRKPARRLDGRLDRLWRQNRDRLRRTARKGRGEE